MARILLAFDGSDGAMGAVTALSHWDLQGSHVTIVTVLPEAEWPSRQVARMRETLARTLRRHGARPELALRNGSPTREILSLAEQCRADLIVLGPRKRPALSQWLLGSVSQGIIDQAPCSILVGRLSLATERAMVIAQEEEDLVRIQRGWDRLPLPRHLEVYLVGVRRAVPVLSEIPVEARHRWPELIPQQVENAESARIQALLQEGNAYFRGRKHLGLSLTTLGPDVSEILDLEKQLSPELIGLRLDCSPTRQDLIARARASVLLIR